MGIEAMERTRLKSVSQRFAVRAQKSMLRLPRIFSCFLLSSILYFLSSTFAAHAESLQTSNQTSVIIMVGAAGEEDYGKEFERWAGLWSSACDKGGARHITIGMENTNSTSDLERLKAALAAGANDASDELWLVLLGHGTFDGKEAKFNLRGPDLSATDLAAWLRPFKRPLAIINCAAASAPFLNKLSASNRVIITATRSGYEQNYARFGRYLSEAIADPQADLDKDGQTSLLEAFLMASRRVDEFYANEGRLVTEHSLLDDNGDGLGTPADWFRGTRAIKRAKDGAAPDGLRAHQFNLIRSPQDQQLSPAQRARRDELELAVNRLRDKKDKLAVDDYYRQLEAVLVELAKVSAQQTAIP
jgi:hypothetical protein